MTGRRVAAFLDFDGTVTIRDATDAILERFADRGWLQLEDAWLSGQIGSRECLAAQMALVTATEGQIERLLDTIDVDPGFGTLLDVCAAQDVPVAIVSDGFDYCINRILGRPALNLRRSISRLHVVSSSLRWDGGRWHATFGHDTCAHGCATCKPAAIARLAGAGALRVFVGDGLSDRYAAGCADIVFAKGKLAEYCERASIPYTPYDTLAAVASCLTHVQTGAVFPAV